ncbi:acyl carrier protein [Longispora sp. NPDC051575]|uniref:acyl carrier protein n=1 Tax=Longispora sp. NPDC051575 TaxID=3154943 RepID=UPI00344867F5
MRQLTTTDLKDLMTACLGETAETVLPDGDAYLDTSFEELDFDSLARVELGEKVMDEYKISLPDGLVDQTPTPRALLAHINQLLATG